MPDDVRELLDGAEVLAHDAALLLAHAVDGAPESLRGELRRVRAMLVDALQTLDEAAPLADSLYNAGP